MNSKDVLIKLIDDITKCNDCDIDKLADCIIKDGWARLPCKVGDMVYKICPKCNKDHNGNCKHCAWSGCLGGGCDIGVRVYSDGSCNQHDLQIISYKVTENRFVTILKYWNLMFFANIEEADRAKIEYDKIRNIEDRAERYKKYLSWETNREQHYSFLGSEEQ